MKKKIYMCGNQRAGGQGCVNRGQVIWEALQAEAEKRGSDVELIKGTCLGYCGEGPNVKIHGGEIFNAVEVMDVPAIFDALSPKRRRARRA